MSIKKLPYILCIGLLSSCSTISSYILRTPVPYERSYVETNTVAAIDVWEPCWETIQPGIAVTGVTIANPRLEAWAVRINTTDPGITPVVGPEPDASGYVASVKTSTFAKQNDCLVAINTTPFDPMPRAEGDPVRSVGVVIQKSTLYAAPDPRYAALVFLQDKTIAVLEQSEIDSCIQQVEYAAGGFFIVLREGEPTGNTEYRNPRSAAGVSKEKTILYLLVIDGRRSGSAGATAVETGKLLQRLGAWEGLIFDGGGSTTLALQRDDGSIGIVNVPVHQGVPGRERPVASCLGFCQRAP